MGKANLKLDRVSFEKSDLIARVLENALVNN